MNDAQSVPQRDVNEVISHFGDDIAQQKMHCEEKDEFCYRPDREKPQNGGISSRKREDLCQRSGKKPIEIVGKEQREQETAKLDQSEDETAVGKGKIKQDNKKE